MVLSGGARGCEWVVVAGQEWPSYRAIKEALELPGGIRKAPERRPMKVWVVLEGLAVGALWVRSGCVVGASMGRRGSVRVAFGVVKD